MTKVLEEGIKKILEKSRSKKREKVETIITEGNEYLVEFELKCERVGDWVNRFTIKNSAGEELSRESSYSEGVIAFTDEALSLLRKEWRENKEYQYSSCMCYSELYDEVRKMIDKQLNEYLGDTVENRETRSYRLEVKYRTDKEDCVVLSSKSYRMI